MKPTLAALLAKAGAPAATAAPKPSTSKPPPPPASRAALLAAVERFNVILEEGKKLWARERDAKKEALGREFLTTEEMNEISRRPEFREKQEREDAEREVAKAALVRYRRDANLDPKETDFLESWLYHGVRSFEEALQRAELQEETRRRTAANKPALEALVAEVHALPETPVEAFVAGDYGIGTVDGMPPVFQVEKVTHRGARVMVRRLNSADPELVKLKPGVARAYMRSGTWYRRVPKPLADRYVELWYRIYGHLPQASGKA